MVDIFFSLLPKHAGFCADIVHTGRPMVGGVGLGLGLGIGLTACYPTLLAILEPHALHTIFLRRGGGVPYRTLYVPYMFM